MASPYKLLDQQGAVLCSTTERIGRWREYFETLLNVPAQVNPEFIATLTRLPVAHSLGDTPTFQEFYAAVLRFKKGKAGGLDGIPAEVLQHLSFENLKVMYEHVVRVWSQVVPFPKEWLSGFLVLLPLA